MYTYLLQDGNGEISQEEMEDVFLKMCKIVEKTEVGEDTKHDRSQIFGYLIWKIYRSQIFSFLF